MIGNESISVLITTYRRFERLDEICQAWLAEPVDQVWLLDNSMLASQWITRRTRADARFAYWPLPLDMKTRADYGVALLTDGDWIVCADDDIAPAPGFCADMLAGMKAAGAPMGGVIGRALDSPDYKKTAFYASNKIAEPVEVGFVGVCYVAARRLFGFDTRGMGANCDDLWHSLKAARGEKKVVVPTKKYRNLPECRDSDAMCHVLALMEQRKAFWARMWSEIKGEVGAHVDG